jgi:uncharacterized protein
VCPVNKPLFPANNPKPVIRQFVVPVLVLVLSMSSGACLAQAIELRLADDSYQIELAQTAKQRRKGLMHRQSLSPRQGMLLVYPEAGDHRIWMKNMLIPIRVYWIDENFTIIDMQRLQPCRASPCPVYSVDEDSRYVLELGDYEHRLKPGDRIESLREL